MKIDELISELEQVKEEHGNLEVKSHNPGLATQTKPSMNVIKNQKKNLAKILL